MSTIRSGHEPTSPSHAPTEGDPPSPLLRRLLYGMAALFIALHQDFWAWTDRDFVLGLPSGLTYHFFYCLAAAGLMALLVRHAWPHDLAGGDSAGGGEQEGGR